MSPAPRTRNVDVDIDENETRSTSSRQLTYRSSAATAGTETDMQIYDYPPVPSLPTQHNFVSQAEERTYSRDMSWRANAGARSHSGHAFEREVFAGFLDVDLQRGDGRREDQGEAQPNGDDRPTSSCTGSSVNSETLNKAQKPEFYRKGIWGKLHFPYWINRHFMHRGHPNAAPTTGNHQESQVPYSSPRQWRFAVYTSKPTWYRSIQLLLTTTVLALDVAAVQRTIWSPTANTFLLAVSILTIMNLSYRILWVRLLAESLDWAVARRWSSVWVPPVGEALCCVLFLVGWVLVAVEVSSRTGPCKVGPGQEGDTEGSAQPQPDGEDLGEGDGKGKSGENNSSQTSTGTPQNDLSETEIIVSSLEKNTITSHLSATALSVSSSTSSTSTFPSSTSTSTSSSSASTVEPGDDDTDDEGSRLERRGWARRRAQARISFITRDAAAAVQATWVIESPIASTSTPKPQQANYNFELVRRDAPGYQSDIRRVTCGLDATILFLSILLWVSFVIGCVTVWRECRENIAARRERRRVAGIRAAMFGAGMEVGDGSTMVR
ncbi:hypothetical protein BDZ91DRAFT_713217 [Kalaharituber pfeilii]|nr:hypothetical protein BDZ91DRAFT_713217 [Kalaharituber pfeilii]